MYCSGGWAANVMPYAYGIQLEIQTIRVVELKSTRRLFVFTETRACRGDEIECGGAKYTGAVNPDVAVTVENLDTGVVFHCVTDGTGAYDTVSIIPDHYKPSFKKDGFSALERGPITIDVGVTGINESISPLNAFRSLHF